MCAIAGIIALPAPESVQQGMEETMRRRGPDATGVWQCDQAVLIHTRLAVIDPAGGQQPMTLSWKGEEYTLVYNGELYNTQQVRAALIGKGHHFLSHSDTEVLLHAYAQWGEACLQRLNGIFAFAVWEKRAKRLFLARDRIGVKPLFYMEHRGGLLFASQMKTILSYPTVRAALDPQGASELLLIGPGRTPGCGVFHEMKELLPGHWAIWTEGKLQTVRYWALQHREHLESFEDTVAHVRALVTDAIDRQTVSDVPIGTFLSGGLDSSLITALCANRMKDRQEILHTFSLDYENQEQYFRAGKFQPDSDTSYIRLMQQKLNTQAHWTVLSPQQLLDALEEATVARDLPGMADVDFSLLLFCKDIRKHVKVALSGECADEIFGGYPWYRDPQIRSLSGFPWSQNAHQRCELLSESVTGKVSPMDYIRDRYQATCALSDVLPGTSAQERRMKEMFQLNFYWFMQTLLERKDRMSMYSGLEVRVPFCDERIAQYLYSVPWEYKNYAGKEKGLLRMAMDGLLPKEILWRKKSPYPKTFDPRYTQLVMERFRTLLEDPAAPLFYLVQKERLRDLMKGEQPWPWYGQLMGQAQTAAFFLQIDFWLRHYRVDFLF